MSWDVLSSQAPGLGDFTIIIDIFHEGNGGGPGGGDPPHPITPPVGGAFQSLVDDDVYLNNSNVPTPLYEELIPAMAGAFIEVFVTLDDPDVPFVLNVDPGAPFEAIVNENWNAQVFNTNAYWGAYLLGAHQGEQGKDTDPEDENTENEVPKGVIGETSTGSGGSMIYLETLVDRTSDPAPSNIPAAVWHPYEMELDTVVHEIGHAVGDDALTEPVTRIGEGIVGRYTEQYLVSIRTIDKPAGP